MTAPKRIPYRGAELTMRELAKATGHTYACLSGRWRKGDREEKLWRPLDCVGANSKGRLRTSLRGEGVSVSAREAEAARREDKLQREQSRADRIAAARAAHAAAMSAPLIDAALLTAAEHLANQQRVRNSGQRSWRVTGASMGVAL